MEGRRREDDGSTASTRAETQAETRPVGRAPEPSRPRTIGRYAIVDTLGAGGMGTVYRAYDPELDRHVALKVLHDTAADAQTRLRREAMAMAQLSHPNVLPIYDVSTARDRLFIAMELVEGDTLRRWLETPRPWVELLEVFIPAAHGLWAAHQAEMIHRDFKPGNVMIGDDGRVRVMDFGLARGTLGESRSSQRHSATLASTRVSRRSLPRASAPSDPLVSLNLTITEAGTVMGTPVYMAPEQHYGESVDARSDQYAFCVALWQALYGRYPFEGNSLDALLRAKVEDLPRGDERRAVPRWLRAAVTRGLAADPERRFPSMMDVITALSRGRRRRRQRRLGIGAVVVAGSIGALAMGSTLAPASPPCTGHSEALADVWDDERAAQIGRAFAAAGPSFATATWQRAEPRLHDYARRWRDAAIDNCEATHVHHRQSPAAMDARRRCLEQRRRALRTLVTTLSEPDARVVEHAVRATAGLPAIESCAQPGPGLPRPSDPIAAEEADALERELELIRTQSRAGRAASVLDHAHEVLSRAVSLNHAPLEAQALLQTGRLEVELGRYEDASARLEASYFLAQRADLDSIRARAAIDLIHLHGHHRGDPERGRRWARFAESSLESVDEPALEADYLANRGLLYKDEGDLDRAQEHLERALAIRERDLDPESPEVTALVNDLALLYDDRAEYARAIALHERVLAIRERGLGPDHPSVATSLSNLSHVHRALGHGDVALQQRLRALSIYERAYGPEHPRVADTLLNIGALHDNRNEPELALARYSAALSILRRLHGDEHPRVARALSNIGNVHWMRGDREQARAHFERTIQTFEQALGPDDPSLVIGLSNLAGVSYELGRYDDALRHAERALGIVERTNGPHHPLVASLQRTLAATHRTLGDFDRARDLLDAAVDVRRRSLGSDHVGVAQLLRDIARLEMKRGQPEAALEPLRDALEVLSTHDDQAAQLHETRFSLARAQWARGGAQRAEARRTAAAALDGMRALDQSERAEPIIRWLDEHPAP